MREFMNGHGYGAMVSMLMTDMQGPDGDKVDGFVSILVMLDSTCSVFGVVLNIFWVVIFIIPCIYCNELSRSALPVITSKLVEDDAKTIVSFKFSNFFHV